MTSTPHDSAADGHGAVDCGEALSKLFEFLDAEIGDLDGDRIRAHLADCEPCLAEYDIEDHLKALVRRCCQEAAPADLRVRIMSQITHIRLQMEG